MTISNIKIEGVRGIKSLEITDKIFKNQPNILVVANGFGKTSIAVAFKCIAGQTFLNLPDEERHLHNATTPARINLDIEESGQTKTLSVNEDAHSNKIRKNLDIHVIGDMRRIKASIRNMGGFSAARAKQVIDPIVVCNKPTEIVNPYKVSSAKQVFGNHARLLKNLETELFKSQLFIMRSTEFVEAIKPLIRERKWSKIEYIREKISSHAGDDAEAINAVAADIQQVLAEADFELAAQIIVDTSDQDKSSAFLSIWQLVFLAREDLEKLSGYLEWLRYKEIRKSLKAHVADLNSSWKNVSVKEVKGELVVELPDPSHISNGQRDILLLVAMFHVAKHQLTKEKAILIIDEVFDYLDDANLTVAQYYITELIKDYKQQGRVIYPIILTHLNPAFFKNYVFSNQNVIYLDKNHSYDSCDAMKKLISARNDVSVAKSIRKDISKYLVHYYADEFDFFTDLETIKGTRPSWGRHEKFQVFIEEEFNKYKNKQSYDPLAICAITRRTIEMLAYKQIEHLQDAKCFFDVHKTSPKLVWASQRGANVPETHYLLRVIFDDGLHWNLGRDNTISIVAKLGNPIIKKLIVDLVSPHLSIGNTP